MFDFLPNGAWPCSFALDHYPLLSSSEHSVKGMDRSSEEVLSSGMGLSLPCDPRGPTEKSNWAGSGGHKA